MKRVVTPSSSGGANIDSALVDSEFKLAKIMFACGLDPASIDEVEIDDLVDTVKHVFSGSVSQSNPLATNLFTSRIRWTMLVTLRWELMCRKILKGVEENG